MAVALLFCAVQSATVHEKKSKFIHCSFSMLIHLLEDAGGPILLTMVRGVGTHVALYKEGLTLRRALVNTMQTSMWRKYIINSVVSRWQTFV